MSLYKRILLFLTAAVLAVGAVSCSGSHDDEPETPAYVMLTIRVNLPDNDNLSRAVGDEYEPDKEAKAGEAMQSLRIIIVDQNGSVEHNSLWDAFSTPVTQSSVRRFKVKGNEDKTIILVANEEGTTITDRNGNKMAVTDYLNSLNASVGTHVNLDDLYKLTMSLADNKSNGTTIAGNVYADNYDGDLRVPLAINDIYTNYHIGNKPEQTAIFYVRRAAVKYTFRIVNKSTDNDGNPLAHTLNKLTIGRVADSQFFFQNAVYTDADHWFWSSYTTPAGVTTRDMVLDFGTGTSIPADGKVHEFGPYYVPEGATYVTPYQVGIALDGIDMGMHDISWHMPQTPDDVTSMLDLPRNAHIITEITIQDTKPEFRYTICPWDEHKIEIPPFN